MRNNASIVAIIASNKYITITIIVDCPTLLVSLGGTFSCGGPHNA